MVVVGRVVLVMTDGPGLPGISVHVPAPVPLIVAVPPGRRAHTTVLSVPAFGFAVTTIDAVSVHALALVQMKKYVPGALYVVIVVVGLVGVVITAVPGLPVMADHVPAPVPVIVAEPPGNIAQVTI